MTPKELYAALERELRAGAIADGIDPDDILHEDILFFMDPEEIAGL